MGRPNCFGNSNWRRIRGSSAIAAVVLVLLGGTTWLSGGFWAPDGAYSRFVSPIIGLVVGRGREPGPLDPESRYACWMVMPTLGGRPTSPPKV